MSREIKFRGWIDKPRWEGDNCANKMYYGIQNSYDTLGDVEPEDIMQSFDEWFEDENYCIVEQYTGLKDKNGKEIYEGDIVKKYDDGDIAPVIGIVEFCKSGARFGVNGGRHLLSQRWEVIGNIHENPELLEN